MKQYDSYLILGCHFPKSGIELIISNSSLKYFNNKIKNLYGCEIIEVNVPISDVNMIKQYYVKICMEQSDESILKLESLVNKDYVKFKELLGIFEIESREPYLIAVPIVRELPSYE